MSTVRRSESRLNKEAQHWEALRDMKTVLAQWWFPNASAEALAHTVELCFHDGYPLGCAEHGSQCNGGFLEDDD